MFVAVPVGFAVCPHILISRNAQVAAVVRRRPVLFFLLRGRGLPATTIVAAIAPAVMVAPARGHIGGASVVVIEAIPGVRRGHKGSGSRRLRAKSTGE